MAFDTSLFKTTGAAYPTNTAAMGTVPLYFHPEAQVQGVNTQNQQQQPQPTPQPTPQDIAAQQQAAAEAKAMAAARTSFNSGLGTLNSSIGNSMANWGIGYGKGWRNLGTSIQNGQDAINTMGAKNELNRDRGTAGVLGMVGRGTKSAGVMLGNKNAGDSSAAMALAKAYGQLGSNQMSNVGNQYALENMDITTQQKALDKQEQDAIVNMQEDKQIFINQTISDATAQINDLNTMAQNASIPERIALEQKINEIKAQATATLQGYENTGRATLAGINPRSLAGNRTEANKLRDAGTNLGQDAFNYTDQAPMGMGNIGPAGGSLPLYVLPRQKRVA